MLGHLFKMKSSKNKIPAALIPDETALEIRKNKLGLISSFKPTTLCNDVNF